MRRNSSDIAGHFTQSEIARRRGVSLNTLRKRIASVEEKIGAHSMGDAARFWQENAGAWVRLVAAKAGVEWPRAG